MSCMCGDSECPSCGYAQGTTQADPGGGVIAARLTLAFGALAPPIRDQLAEQGFALPRIKLAAIEQHAKGITWLSIAGLLTEAETRRARQRLIKRVRDEVRIARERAAEGGAR